MVYKSLRLKRGKEESVLRGHPWIFSGAVQRMDEGIEEGDVVRVLSSSGDCLGVGHYQIGSIAVRLLAFADTVIDDSFWEQHIASAYRLRQTLGLVDDPANTIYRLVYGEGDGLPGLIVDCYGATAVVQAHTVGIHRSRYDIAQAIVRVLSGRVRNVYYKSETTLPYKANVGPEDTFLLGTTAENVAMERGLRFHIDWLHGQKTGFFVDQRDNRGLLERYARGRRVLNMFCYTGGFSVYALRGGAESVCSVDSSEKAIDLTEENVRLNFGAEPRHTSCCADAFEYLKTATGYDLIVLDPPAFAKHRGAVSNALKGYIRLNTLGLERLQPGGILFTFTCSQIVTKDQFRQVLLTAALRAKRQVRILHQLHQSTDHPINLYHPEGEYLKGFVAYVE